MGTKKRSPSPTVRRAPAARGEGPRTVPAVPRTRLRYVLHEHDARTHHFDLRLEMGGALVSWAVPKGPSLEPADKRLAVRVEDHPLEYGEFEGEIPEGHYGAGQVRIADRGTWVPEGDPATMLAHGKIAFEIVGGRYAGRWALVRMARPIRGGGKENWLLIRRATPE